MAARLNYSPNSEEQQAKKRPLLYKPISQGMIDPNVGILVSLLASANPLMFKLHPARITDFDFAERLVRTNMRDYHSKHNMRWDKHYFHQNWLQRSNYLILKNHRTVGLLSMSLYQDNAYIRELQVLPEQQGQGAGSFALQQAEKIARQHGCTNLRLKVFVDNPALALYDRYCFQAKMLEQRLIGMEKRL